MSAPAQPRIVIYSTRTCSDCVRSKRFLEEHGLSYELHELEAEPELRDVIMGLNAQLGSQSLTQVPVILIDSLVLSEPSNDQLAAALGIA